MRLQTALTRLVGVEHPVVQTGMGWVAGARLVSATANAGGLGILASATMTRALTGASRAVSSACCNTRAICVLPPAQETAAMSR